MRSRVIPGSSPTIERRLLVIRLNSVLFPTLGRPTIATSGSAPAPSVAGTTDLRYVGKTHLQPPGKIRAYIHRIGISTRVPACTFDSCPDPWPGRGPDRPNPSAQIDPFRNLGGWLRSRCLPSDARQTEKLHSPRPTASLRHAPAWQWSRRPPRPNPAATVQTPRLQRGPPGRPAASPADPGSS